MAVQKQDKTKLLWAFRFIFVQKWKMLSFSWHLHFCVNLPVFRRISSRNRSGGEPSSSERVLGDVFLHKTKTDQKLSYTCQKCASQLYTQTQNKMCARFLTVNTTFGFQLLRTRINLWAKLKPFLPLTVHGAFTFPLTLFCSKDSYWQQRRKFLLFFCFAHIKRNSCKRKQVRSESPQTKGFVFRKGQQKKTWNTCFDWNNKQMKKCKDETNGD